MKVSNKESSLTTRSAEMKKVTYPHCCLITALYLFVFTSELKFTKTSYQKVLPTDSQKKKKKKKWYYRRVEVEAMAPIQILAFFVI